MASTRTRRANRLGFFLTLSDGPPDLEIGEQGLNTPAHAIVEDGVFRWGYIHGDDPRLLAPFFMDHADIGDDARPVKFCVYKAFGGQFNNLPAGEFILNHTHHPNVKLHTDFEGGKANLRCDFLSPTYDLSGFHLSPKGDMTRAEVLQKVRRCAFRAA